MDEQTDGQTLRRAKHYMLSCVKIEHFVFWPLRHSFNEVYGYESILK